MVRYSITGNFKDGIEWEDFLSRTGPSVTLITNSKRHLEVVAQKEINWFEVYVEQITKDVACAILALVNNCASHEVEIVENNFTMAI